MFSQALERYVGLDREKFKSVKEIAVDLVELAELLVAGNNQAWFVSLKNEIFREIFKELEFFEVMDEFQEQAIMF